MQRASQGLVWAFVALGGLGCAARPSNGAVAGTTAEPAVTMARLRAAIDRHICAEWSPEAQAWGGPLLGEECPRPATRVELERVAEAVVVRVRPVLMLATAAGDRFEAAVRGQPAAAQSTADSLARAALWRDPQVARAMALALREELGVRGWNCVDCPVVTAPEPRSRPWAAFLPYLRAYLWPLDGADGAVEIYTCSGINGADTVAPDERLLQAGVLTALAFAQDDATAAQIHEVAVRSRSASEAAAHLEALLDAPPGRAHACAALAGVEWFTGLRVDECPRRTAPPRRGGT